MNSSNDSSALREKSVVPPAVDIADLGEQSPPSSAQPAAPAVSFGGVSVCADEDESRLQEPLDGDSGLQEIEHVVPPHGYVLTPKFIHILWVVNFAIALINSAVNKTTALDPSQIARALRDHTRFRGNQAQHHIHQFLRRILTNFKRIANQFDPMHPANFVVLLSLGFCEEQSRKLLKSFNGHLKPFNGGQKTTPRDRMAWFWIFINLRMRTSIFQSDDGIQAFFAHATNSGDALSQEFAKVEQAAFSQFDAQVPKCGQPTRKAQSCGSGVSVAGSDFSTMTQTGGYLWKFHAALSAISRLLNEWFGENEHLMDERARMSEESLIELVLRVIAKMQCSKTGQFGTERSFSTHIYIKLMQAFWKAKKAGKRFTLRFYETFSSILCATGNYEAAIEWLSRALECEHPNEAEPTLEEIAILKFAFIAISLGVQSLASCTPDNLGALFAHIFNDEELEVEASEAVKFESAINRVAEDFETEPQATHDSSEVPTPELSSRGRSCGSAAVDGGHAAHRASEDARRREFKKMLQEAAAADPAKKEQLMKWWLANSK
jgi:hypothetical protein